MPESIEQKLERLEQWLHDRCQHPDYEYRSTVEFGDGPPEGMDGWVVNGGAIANRENLTVVCWRRRREVT